MVTTSGGSPDIGLFDQGPFTQPLEVIKLSGRGPGRVMARAAIAALVAWVPIVLLAAVQGLALNDNPRESVLLDVRIHTVYLLALPLLVIAETSVLQRLASIAKHFWDSGVVPPERRSDFHAAVASARRRLTSRWVTAIMVLAAFGLVLAARQWLTTEDIALTWRTPERLGGEPSLAALWQRWVGLPLFFGAFLVWVWRFGVWGLFLRSVSRLDLRLVPSDPDGRGGLGILATALPPCGLIGFALSAAVAGGMMGRILLHGASPLPWKFVPVVLVGVIVLLCVTPLLALYPTMLKARRRAGFEYRTLTLAVGRQFQAAWLASQAGDAPEALKTTDFSATTDLFAVAANAYRMSPFPLDLPNLVSLVVPTLLPFIPVALTIVPVGELLQGVLRLVV